MASTFKQQFSNLNLHLSKKTLRARGEKLREENPYSTLGQFNRLKRDPLKFIKKSENLLIPELLDLRNKKMVANPFAFFRGTAELMATDLRKQEHSGIPVILCGDAHINNYGFFASAEGQLLFDLNDFDESHIGNFEDDLKRLLVSVDLAGDLHNFGSSRLLDLMEKVSRAYRKGVKYAYKLSLLKRFYFISDVRTLFTKFVSLENSRELLTPVLKKARRNNSERAVKKYTTTNAQGDMRFTDNAPTSVHISAKNYRVIEDGFKQYRSSVRPDVNAVLAQYKIVDIIRHSVGVGSFGTRCYLILLVGNDGSHLVLQVKEALPVHDAFIPKTIDLSLHQQIGEGQRIVASQKILQTASDPFLGSFQSEKRAFYIRQYRNMKGSVDISQLDWDNFKIYTQTCGFLLAMAHFKSPTGPMIRGYLKKGKDFDKNVSDWSMAYSDQVQSDYDAFKQSLSDSGALDDK